MAGNVPATLLRDLHAIVASCHDALEQGIEGNLKQVRARLVECQIIVQAVLEESARLLRAAERTRVGETRAVTGLPPALQSP
jgi:hypothetical protein